MDHREPLYSEFADDSDMAEILQEFVEGMQETGVRLRQYLAAGNDAEMRRIGHQLKGAGASYGFEEITIAGAALERAVEAGDDVDARVDEMIVLFERAHAGLFSQRS